jgi:hypothetical protein
MSKLTKMFVSIVVIGLVLTLIQTLKYKQIHYYKCEGSQVENNVQLEFNDVVVIREYFLGSKGSINDFELAQCSKDNEVLRCASEVSGDSFNLLESHTAAFDMSLNKYQSELRSVDKGKNIDNKILIEASCTKYSDKTLRVGRDKE